MTAATAKLKLGQRFSWIPVNTLKATTFAGNHGQNVEWRLNTSGSFESDSECLEC